MNDTLEASPSSQPAPPPTVVPSTSPRPEPPSLSGFDDHFKDLEDAPAPAPETKPVPPKDPASGKFVKKDEVASEPKTEEPKVEEPKPEPEKPKTELEPKTEFDPPQIAKPSELRSWAKNMGKRAQTAHEEMNRMRNRIRELESKAPQEQDVTALTEQLAAATKKIEQYEGEVRLTKYERSQEYKEKYESPYQDAVRSAYGEVKELFVTIPNPEDPEHPKERPATEADFDEIYQLPLGPATKLAHAKFGEAASIVIAHRKAIRDRAQAAVKAVEEHKTKGAEYEKQQTAQQRMREEGMTRMFNTAVEGLQTKYPTWFGEREGDKEWNEAMAHGRQVAELAYGDGRDKLTPDQSAILNAQIYHRIASWPALKVALTRTEAKLKELEKAAQEKRASAPGAAQPNGEATPQTAGRGSLEMFDKYVKGD